MPITIETFQEFCQRHGGEESLVRVGDSYVFPDGAQTNEASARSEPPENAYHRLCLLRDRAKKLLKVAEGAFANTQSRLTEMCSHAQAYSNPLPIPGDGDVKRLEHLAAHVTKRRAELANLERQIADTPEGRARRQRHENELKRKTDIHSIYQRIVSITVPNIESLDESDLLESSAKTAIEAEGDLLNTMFKQAGVKIDA